MWWAEPDQGLAFAEKIIGDRRYIKTLLLSGFAFAAAVILPSIPFVLNKPVGFLPGLYMGTMASYPYATLNAANLFGAFGANFADQTQRFMGITYQSFGTIAIITAIILSGIIFFKSKEKGKIFYCSGLLLTIIFTFGVRMHERYLFPVAVLFLMAYIYSRKTQPALLHLRDHTPTERVGHIFQPVPPG